MQYDLHNFMQKVGSDIVLIRHDKHPETPPHPRGGFLVGQAMLPETLEYFFELKRIVAVYEPSDPLLNGHNLNLMFENDRQISIEVVGPGFDASDLQRGDLSPHESFSASFSSDGGLLEIKLIGRVDQKAYEESIRARKEKVRQKLNLSPAPSLARKILADLKIPEDLDTHLQQVGSPLYNSRNYQPVAEGLLESTINRIISSGVVGVYLSLTSAKFPLVFSTSLVNKGAKQFFWDIVSPALKFEGFK